MHTVLLKRSDAPVYLVHTCPDWEEAGAILESSQAFVVKPILVMPNTIANAPTIDEPCRLLRNKWFFAPSDEEAASVMMRCRPSSDVESHGDLNCARSDAPSSCGDIAQDKEQGRTPNANTDGANDARACANLWEHVVPCNSQEATKAVDIRSVLAATLGKAEATRILAHCVASVAKNANGQKNRILKAPSGECLKLKQVRSQ